jgi:hypothetical protein
MRKFVFGGSFLNSTGYIVDDFNPAASYSLRKVKTTATLSIKVRRSSDNTELDIGFVGDDLDTSALLTFVGAGDGFISRIYNQGGVGNPFGNIPYLDAILSIATTQPKIVASGVLITQNGKPSCLFDGAGDRITFGLYDGTLPTLWDIYTTMRVDTGQQFVVYVNSNNTNTGPGGSFYSVGVDGSALTNIYTSTAPLATYVNGANTTMVTRNDVYDFLATNNLLLFQYSQMNLTGFGFNGYGNPTWDFIGYWSESIFFENNDTSSERTAIETNINAYYGIY